MIGVSVGRALARVRLHPPIHDLRRMTKRVSKCHSGQRNVNRRVKVEERLGSWVVVRIKAYHVALA